MKLEWTHERFAACAAAVRGVVGDELAGGCMIAKPAWPDGLSGVEGIVPASSSNPSSDSVDLSGESNVVEYIHQG